jgi:hypothetical protein
MILTEEEAISLLCQATGKNDDATQKAAKAALRSAMYMLLDSSGGGWEFQKTELTLTTTSGTSDYYVNKTNDTVGVADTLILNPKDDLVSVVHNGWYLTRTLRKYAPNDFRRLYQGGSSTGAPYAFTAIGNQIKLYPAPDGAYAIVFEVTKLPGGIEGMPSRKQYAPILSALQLMFPPGSPDFVKANAVAQMVKDTFASGDGVLDMNDATEGDFPYENID